MNFKSNTAMLCLFMALTGCATIIGSSTQVMPISSTPSDAAISITDEKGTEIFKGMTPTTVTLQKNTGSYFGKKSYSVKISKDGYESAVIPVTASANGWYIGGNIIFGGLIGWLIVDPFNGGMYTLSPEYVNATLAGGPPQNNPEQSNPGHNTSSANGSITVMLMQDVPDELRSKLHRVN